MLSSFDYLKRFKEIQDICVSVTEKLILEIQPGMSEKVIADRYSNLLAEDGLVDHWYPIIVYAGSWTGKPITRKVHLPSDEVVVQEQDIVFVDCTPIDKTVWGNWCRTIAIGENPFFKQLCDDCDAIVAKTENYAKSEAKTIGELFAFCNQEINCYELKSLDPRNDVGHSIFQVPEGQLVDKTPLEDRLFINEEYRNTELSGLISIEPQLGRINPDNGVMYGAKQQKVVVYDFD